MLAIHAHYHDGYIHLAQEDLPRDAKVVVVFLDTDGVVNTANSLSAEQHAALHVQSQSQFAQTVLLNPAEDCWNNV
jgi:hypothetical protein